MRKMGGSEGGNGESEIEGGEKERKLEGERAEGANQLCVFEQNSMAVKDQAP